MIIFVDMLRGYKYRLYPNRAQRELIKKHIGSCRFVYNLALEVKNTAYISQRVSLSCIDLINQLPELKKECEWLKEVDSQALQQSVVNLDKAFTQFFKKAAQFPNYKSKHKGNQSFRSPHGSGIKIEGNKVSLPKFKEGIKIVRERTFKGDIKSATISCTSTGKYFISILVDTKLKEPKKNLVKEKTAIGVDLGIKSFIVTSDGQKFDNPKYLKVSLERLKVLQRRVSRKKKGSTNRKKAIKILAILHEKVANQRRDFLHKLSTELVKNHDTICMEDLAVKNMVKNHRLAQAISDAGWGMFEQFITYKCEWYGKNKLTIPTFEPSTKVCNKCGAINHTLTLADREWTCAMCNSLHDRDTNAAIVIKKYCLNKSGSANPVEPVELPTLAGALKQEDVTFVH